MTASTNGLASSTIATCAPTSSHRHTTAPPRCQRRVTRQVISHSTARAHSNHAAAAELPPPPAAASRYSPVHSPATAVAAAASAGREPLALGPSESRASRPAPSTSWRAATARQTQPDHGPEPYFAVSPSSFLQHRLGQHGESVSRMGASPTAGPASPRPDERQPPSSHYPGQQPDLRPHGHHCQPPHPSRHQTPAHPQDVQNGRAPVSQGPPRAAQQGDGRRKVQAAGRHSSSGAGPSRGAAV